VSRPPDSALDRGFRLAYGVGLALCVAWPLALQALLGTLIPPGPRAAGEAVLQLGYTFTGLTLASAMFVLWRWGRVRRSFGALDRRLRARVLAREILVYSALFEASSLFGLLYYALGGPQAERYARGFLALTPVMFLVFVPRLRAWREAAREE